MDSGTENRNIKEKLVKSKQDIEFSYILIV